MQMYKLTVTIFACLMLAACGNTIEGVRSDTGDLGRMVTRDSPTMQKYAATVPTGYSGQRQVVLKGPRGGNAPDVFGYTYDDAPVTAQPLPPVNQDWKSGVSGTQFYYDDTAYAAPAMTSDDGSVTVYPLDGEAPRGPMLMPNMAVDAPANPYLGDMVSPSYEEAAPYAEAHAAISGRLIEQIYFPSGSNRLRNSDKQKVADAAEIILATGLSPSVTVVGHASRDSTDRSSANEQAGRKRAEAVASALRKNGVPSSIITVISRGDRDPNPNPPLDMSQSEADRRADIYLDAR